MEEQQQLLLSPAALDGRKQHTEELSVGSRPSPVSGPSVQILVG